MGLRPACVRLLDLCNGQWLVDGRDLARCGCGAASGKLNPTCPVLSSLCCRSISNISTSQRAQGTAGPACLPACLPAMAPRFRPASTAPTAPSAPSAPSPGGRQSRVALSAAGVIGPRGMHRECRLPPPLYEPPSRFATVPTISRPCLAERACSTPCLHPASAGQAARSPLPTRPRAPGCPSRG